MQHVRARSKGLPLDPSLRIPLQFHPDRFHRGGSGIEGLARLLPCPLECHPGFQLSTEELSRHPEYRGADIVEVARGIAPQGLLTPAVVGAAAAAGVHHSQALKKVWHYVARLGDQSVPGAAGVA